MADQGRGSSTAWAPRRLQVSLAPVLREVPPEEWPSVLRAYIRRDGRASPRAAARAARYYIGVDADASHAELRRVAVYYPVFRIEEQ
ncbi:hypothetical protein [Nonomuraea sp. 10N515B]|uniref:hypothetical protein n=1 Tax=Nonomuraea sp. 10N515B TaxID=3457422 RepID=UPI003FCEBD91